MLSIYRAGEIDLFENLDIVHIRLLVVHWALWLLTAGQAAVLKKKRRLHQELLTPKPQDPPLAARVLRLQSTGVPRS